MTTTRTLDEAILEGGIKSPYFFNGRLLTAEALQDEQTAGDLHHRQLGRVIGEGVAEGLTVTIAAKGTGGTTPAVTVAPGLAINRAGQVLELKEEVWLNLVRESSSSERSGTIFSSCEIKEPKLVPSGTGVYVLAVSPAAGFEGKAPMHSLGDSGKLSGCGYKYEKEGLQFKLVLLDITNPDIAGGEIGKNILELIDESGAANRSQLRNLLAHLCLGTETAAGFPVDLFGANGSSAAVQEYGPLDALRQAGCLEDTDVPLALILWTSSGLEFTDMWAVRRRVHSHYVFNKTPYPLTDRRSAELEATHYQFQEHINSILNYKPAADEVFSLTAIKAVDYFRYLPSLGIIPLYIEESGKGFNFQRFFAGLSYKGVYIEGAKLRPLVNLSFSYEPFVPVDIHGKKVVPIRIYAILENYTDTGNIREISNTRQIYVVFTSGQIPAMEGYSPGKTGDKRYRDSGKLADLFGFK